MNIQRVRIEERTCYKCSKNYKVNVYNVLGVEIQPKGRSCPKCCLKQEERQEGERQQRLIEVKVSWFQECVPMKYLKESFETFDEPLQQMAYKRCLDYADGFSLNNPWRYHSLVMISPGTEGVGKTHLACSIIRHILAKWDGTGLSLINNPILFITEPDMFRRIRSTFDSGSSGNLRTETESSLMDQLTRVRLLVLDDVAKEEVGDARFVQRTLFSIINGRYNNMLPIIMTTNKSKEQLEAHLGGSRGNRATYDRLVEMTRARFIGLKGGSYRKRNLQRSQ